GRTPPPGVPPRAAPPPPIEGDNPKSCLEEDCNVVLPACGVACVRVEQYDRYAVTAAVRVPQAHSREIRVSREPCARSLCSGFHKQEQRSRACVQAYCNGSSG